MEVNIIGVTGRTRDAVLWEIAVSSVKLGLAANEKALFDAFVSREMENTTAFESGVAIPHARIDGIKSPAIIVARADAGVDWQSLDGKPTDCAIALLVPAGSNAGDEHMKYLAAIASMLMGEKNIAVFKRGKRDQIEKLLEQSVRDSAQNPDQSGTVGGTFKDEASDGYDFVAVTSCPTGVAHTNMAAEALERFAKNNNLRIKVERQAAQGTVNPLTDVDMAKTDHVILAIGRNIEGRERFAGKRVLEVGVGAPLKNAAKLWEDVRKAPIKSGRPVSSNAAGVAFSNTSGGFPADKEKIHLMRSVMTGLSYMIPVVIVGGIFLAFGLGIGRIALGGDVTTHPGTAWYTVFQIGVAGINLSVVVLGGFIAQAIGGRLALAPAMILAFIAQGIGMPGVGNDSVNWAFFDYNSLEFGVHNSNLSFYGSISAAFLIGFAARYWTRFVSPHIPKAIKTVEPIIIVPLLFVLVGWVLFAFALYVPLYWLSVGLNRGVKGLIDLNLLWIAGAVGGAMLCFDLGGPVNKIAFGTGVVLISSSPSFMGAIAAAGAVAPWGMALGWMLGNKVFKLKNLQDDQMLKESFTPAMFMGFLGIAEGAIPYTLRNPKSAVVSNVIGGAVAGAISGAFLVTDNAAHTGPIVYALGAIGKDGLTDYLWGLIYLAAIVAGSLVTAILFVTIEFVLERTGRGQRQTAERVALKNRGLWPRIKTAASRA